MPNPNAPQKENQRKDPFLFVHSLGFGRFSIAGKYSPAAVRDQVNRGAAIVERAWAAGVLTSDSKLLVKGCGAAGVTATMTAAKLGVQFITLARRGLFFSRQRFSLRMIDPVEYDWPAVGWDAGETVNSRVHLPYRRGRAREIVINHWDPAWRDFLKSPQGKGIEVLDAGTIDESGFNRIFDCSGPGDENTTSGDYRWYEFWEQDPFENPSAGLRARKPSILISGGGDGALQDFLRIVFPGGQTPRDIYRSLNLTGTQRLSLEWQVLNAEDAARRAWVWSADPRIDCTILTKLHEEHHRAAAALLSKTLIERLEEILVDCITPLDRLWLAHSCSHFSPCYAFNHFLILLVDEYCKRSGIGTRLLNARRITSVSSAVSNHTCTREPGNCLADLHTAEFTPIACNGSPPALTGPSDEFDLVVVRHGVSGQVRRLSRQALPYELPRSS